MLKKQCVSAAIYFLSLLLFCGRNLFSMTGIYTLPNNTVPPDIPYLSRKLEVASDGATYNIYGRRENGKSTFTGGEGY